MPSSLHVRFTRKRVVINLSFATAGKTLLCVLLAVAAGLLPIPGLTPASRTCLVIFVGAAALWITELIPAYATSIIVMVLCVYLLGSPDGPLQLAPSGADSWEMFVNPVASPVLVLFFGGLVLAQGATKHGFDIRLARAFITPFGKRPPMLLLGVLATTALFSMFMSNTATTAMMLAVTRPLVSQFEGRDGLRKSLALAVPFAANIGGMGTVIGTPPNAVAASVLASMGPQYEISFLRWMMIGVPLVIVLLLCLWGILLASFKPGREPVDFKLPDVMEVTPGLAIVVLTFVATILLWVTQPLHGVPSAVVALLPIAVFFAFNILDRHDLKAMDWDVMILVAGGLTLGVGLKATGLSTCLVDLVPFEVMPMAVLLGVIMVVAILLSNFMSHTAASNLMIPIACSIVVLEPRIGAMAVALAASLAMSLPVSTPPNAMAFASGDLTIREMAVHGSMVSVAGVLAVLAALLALQRLILWN